MASSPPSPLSSPADAAARDLPPSPSPAAIRPLDPRLAQRIVAGQAVTDLASAVKELVENALDAGAAVINVRLFDQGASIVEVSDDGAGVPPESRALLCTPHATSKLPPPSASAAAGAEPHPLAAPALGFRGEALFALAHLSRSLVVATRTTAEPCAEQLTFRPDGALDAVAGRRAVPRKVGTTVAVLGLLERVPVRRRDLLRRLPQQRARLLRLLEPYAVFCPGVALHLMDVAAAAAAGPAGGGGTGAGATERTLLRTHARQVTLEETVSGVLGPRVAGSLCRLEADLSGADAGTGGEAAAPPPQYRATGLVSHAHPARHCRGVRERQLFAIDRRPVQMPKLVKRLNQVWKSLGHSGRPFLFLQFHLPSVAYDVNLEPDKRTVAMEQEDRILDLVVRQVTDLWREQTDGKFAIGPAAALAGAQQNEAPDASVEDAESNSVVSDEASLNSASEDENDDGDAADNKQDELEPASTPSRFTRRYAFVNDVRRMRLQHQFDDGRRKSIEELEEARKQQILAKMRTAAGDDDDSTVDGADGDQEFHAHTSQQNDDDISASDDTGTNETTSNINELETGQVVKSAEAASIRPALNQTSLTGEFSGPVTAQRECMNQPRNPSNQFDRYRSRDLVVDNTPQSGLERFGFISPKIVSVEFTSAKRKSETDATCSVLKRQKTTDDGVNSESETHQDTHTESSRDQVDRLRVSFDLDGLNLNRPASLDIENNRVEDGEERETSEESEEVLMPPVHKRSDSTIEFNAFTGTNDVILHSRRERLAMRDRLRQCDLSSPTETEHESTADPPTGAGGDIVSLLKEDFGCMRIIGQFNLGFILAVSRNNDLWVLDQHACDEKYNFERLVAETVISEQRLIAPLPLDLTPAEEACVIDHMAIFERNGFRFRVDWMQSPRQRLSLTALPHSGARDGRKAVQFGKEDVSALCHILGVDESAKSHDGTAGAGTGADGSGLYGNNAVRRYTAGSRGGVDSAEKVLVRLPKAIAMFASRACRESIMIGHALSPKEMDRIVTRLKDVEHPWNCPHGRPTMQHVLSLDSLLRGDDRRARALIGDTAATMMSQDMAEE